MSVCVYIIYYNNYCEIFFLEKQFNPSDFSVHFSEVNSENIQMLPHIFVSKEYPLHVFENLISANKFSIVNFFFFLFVVFVVVVLFSAYIEPITQPYFFCPLYFICSLFSFPPPHLLILSELLSGYSESPQLLPSQSSHLWPGFITTSTRI